MGGRNVPVIGVFLYPVKTDKYVSLYILIFFMVGEGDDIGVMIVMEVSFVDFQQIVIRADDEA